MKLKHILMETELSKEEAAQTYLECGYLALEEHMHEPGGCVEEIMSRIGNVIVIAPVRNPVRFFHYFEDGPRAMILQIQAGRLPPEREYSLVKHLDTASRKKRRAGEEAQRDPLLPEDKRKEDEDNEDSDEKEEKTMWTQALESVALLKGLLYGPLDRRLKMDNLRFLIYMLRERYVALIPILRTYRPAALCEEDEKKIKELGEVYIELAADAPALLRLSAEYARFLIREDERLSLDLLTWAGFKEMEDESSKWIQ